MRFNSPHRVNALTPLLQRLRFPPGRAALAKDEVLPLKAQVDRATLVHAQAWAAAWTTPCRVVCMSLALALALGLAADSSFREGRAYLLNTPDKARSVRSACFEQAAKEFAGVFPVDVLETGAIERRRDVLFYFARPDSSARSD